MGTVITLSSLEGFVNTLVGTFLRIAAVLVVGGLIYAGFLMATSPGDSKRYEQGKKMLWQVIVGALVIFGIGIIVNTIASFATNPSAIVH